MRLTGTRVIDGGRYLRVELPSLAQIHAPPVITGLRHDVRQQTAPTITFDGGMARRSMSFGTVQGVWSTAQPRLGRPSFPTTRALLTVASVGQPLPLLAADHSHTVSVADGFVLLAGVLVAGIVSTVRVAKGQLALVGEKGHYRVIPPGVHYRSLFNRERVVARVNQKDAFTIQVYPGEGPGLQGFLVKIHYEINRRDPHVVSTLIEGTDERGQLINALKADVVKGLSHWSDPPERTVGSTKIIITDDKRPNYVANHINGRVGSKLKGYGLRFESTEIIALQ